jgi:acetyltransferase-like isoleucine patch superfamily enzyme
MKLFKVLHLYIISILKVFGLNIFKKLEFAIFKVKWRKKNSCNLTSPVKYFPLNLVTIGDYTYGPIDVYNYFAVDEGLIIGKYCSIAKDVKFILGGNHNTDCLFTFPIKNKFGYSRENEALTKGKIIIEDDVWIGVGATLLSGITIGQGSVIAAGSVVTKSFPPFSIIGGNPSKIIKMRFDEDIRSLLKDSNIKLSTINRNEIEEKLELFSKKLDLKSTKEIISFIKERSN